ENDAWIYAKKHSDDDQHQSADAPANEPAATKGLPATVFYVRTLRFHAPACSPRLCHGDSSTERASVLAITASIVVIAGVLLPAAVLPMLPVRAGMTVATRAVIALD